MKSRSATFSGRVWIFKWTVDWQIVRRLTEGEKEMNKSIAVAKETDAKKASSSTHESDERTHRARNESVRQLGSLGVVIDFILNGGAAPSADSIATQLSGMHTAERTPALLALQQTHGNQYVQRVVSGIQAKLVAGQPGDKYEQEVDQVMRMPDPTIQRKPTWTSGIQTKGISNQSSEITPAFESNIISLRGGRTTLT